MSETFDLVVVGTGAAATTVANRCRAAGWSVAIIDELPYGGTCQLRGCDPKKVLRRGAEVVDAPARQGHRRPGPADRLAEPDALQAQLHRPGAGKQEKAFAEKGIATYRGTARFVTEEAIGIVGQAPTAPSARS